MPTSSAAVWARFLRVLRAGESTQVDRHCGGRRTLCATITVERGKTLR